MAENQYPKGYMAGYWDGIRDATQGRINENGTEDMLNLPVEIMEISTRAKNCLIRTGCKYISEVTKLGEYEIAIMRNVGTKTAHEIAKWLDDQGIHYSAWCKYL